MRCDTNEKKIAMIIFGFDGFLSVALGTLMMIVNTFFFSQPPAGGNIKHQKIYTLSVLVVCFWNGNSIHKNKQTLIITINITMNIYIHKANCSAFHYSLASISPSFIAKSLSLSATYSKSLHILEFNKRFTMDKKNEHFFCTQKHNLS